MKTTVYGRIAVLLILLMALVGASCDRRIDTANSQGTDAGTDSVGQLDVAGDGFVPTTDTALESDTADALESDTADALENDTADALENDTADDSSPSLSWCEGTTHYLYAPLDGTQLYTFPDEFFSVADPSTLTSRRVVMDASNAPWIESMPANLRGAFKTANQLDGFGTTAGIVLQFDAPLGENLPTGDDASLTNGTLMLFELGADGAKRIPFDARRIDDGKTLLLFPMLPLRPKTRHGLVLTTKLLAQDGGCIAPSATLKALLDGSATDPRLVPLVPRYAELLKGAALTPAEVSAAVVFTTQSVFEDSLKMAAKIKTLSFSWDGAPACTVSGAVRKCSSSAWAPASMSSKLSAPMAIMTGRPIADHSE